MLSELEQACKTDSTESSSGLIEFDSNRQRIFVTALTFHLDRAIFMNQKNTMNDIYTNHDHFNV